MNTRFLDTLDLDAPNAAEIDLTSLELPAVALVATNHQGLPEAVESLGELASVSLASVDGLARPDRGCARAPDVVLLALPLVGLDAFLAVGRLRDLYPDAGLLVYARAVYAGLGDDLRRAGAHGLVIRPSEVTTLGEAVRATARQQEFVDPRVRETLTDSRPLGLTPAEMRVLALVPDGLSNADIAARLHVTQNTVKTHVRHILTRLDARDRGHAASIAMVRGVL
ncbi:MAG: LuxR C-terminal-related transcriptional regulator [Candidatus Limnocylindria bacterium]